MIRYAHINWESEPTELIGFIDYDQPPQGIRAVNGNPVLVPAVLEDEPNYDPATHKLVQHQEFSAEQYRRYYEIVALTEAELIERVNAQADAADAEIPAAILRRVLTTLLPEEPSDEDAPLYPAYRVEQSVIAGYVFNYHSILYRVVLDHVTAIQWVPGVGTESLYTRINNPAAPTPAWEPGSYALDAEVTHSDKTWRSRRNNNVWQPGTSDSGWMHIAPTPLTWYYLGGEGYPLNWELSHNAKNWRNNVSNNHWEPGVSGWVEI